MDLGALGGVKVPPRLSGQKSIRNGQFLKELMRWTDRPAKWSNFRESSTISVFLDFDGHLDEKCRYFSSGSRKSEIPLLT